MRHKEYEDFKAMIDKLNEATADLKEWVAVVN